MGETVKRTRKNHSRNRPETTSYELYWASPHLFALCAIVLHFVVESLKIGYSIYLSHPLHIDYCELESMLAYTHTLVGRIPSSVFSSLVTVPFFFFFCYTVCQQHRPTQLFLQFLVRALVWVGALVFRDVMSVYVMFVFFSIFHWFLYILLFIFPFLFYSSFLFFTLSCFHFLSLFCCFFCVHINIF